MDGWVVNRLMHKYRFSYSEYLHIYRTCIVNKHNYIPKHLQETMAMAVRSFSSS